MQSKKILKYQPLVYALIDIRLTTIPNLDKYINQIHAELLSSEHELVDLRQTSTVHTYIEPNPATPGLSVQESTPQSRWDLLNLERSKGAVLSSRHLALKLTHYTTFENMLRMVKDVLVILQRCIPNFEKVGIERMGLRYVDVVIPKGADGEIDAYISANYRVAAPVHIPGIQADKKLDQILSIVPTDIGQLQFSISHNVMQKGVIQLMSPGLFEPEVIALRPQIQEHWRHLGQRKYAILDIDHFIDLTNQPLNYSQDKVLERISNLYAVSKALFLDILTPYAREQYGEYEVN